MKISRSGHFSFDGNTNRQTANGQRKVRVNLQGSFATESKALISLSIDYAQCGTQHITVRFA